MLNTPNYRGKLEKYKYLSIFFIFFLYIYIFILFTFYLIMVHPIPQERELAITSLLLNNASHSDIMSRFPGVGSSTITRLRKFFLTMLCQKSKIIKSAKELHFYLQCIQRMHLYTFHYTSVYSIMMNYHAIRLLSTNK